MKKVLVFLILLLCFGFSQQIPVFKYTPGLTKYSDYWVDSLNAYVWHMTDSVSTITSPLFNPQPGFDGLRQFLCRIDTLGDERDGTHLIIRNFSKPKGSNTGTTTYSQKNIVIDTTTAFNAYFIYQEFLGETYGWISQDTLEWSLYSDTTRVDTTTKLALSNDGLLYTSLFRPVDSDGSGSRVYGIWQTEAPKPWRILGTLSATVNSDSGTVFLKLEEIDHTPNKR